MKSINACKNCHLLTEKNDVCPYCGERVSKRWQGCIIVRDPKRSQMAKKLNITKPGKYALKVQR